MNVPNSAPSPENAQGNNNQSWFEKIDFWQLVKKSVSLFRENKKNLFLLSLYILLTGGQAITIGNLMLQSPPQEEVGIETKQEQNQSENSEEKPPADSWETILKEIEQQEDFKSTLQEIAGNKDFLNILIISGLIIFILLLGIIVWAFLMNSHFHLLYLATIFSLLNQKPTKISQVTLKIKGRWKALSLLRLIFISFYLITAIIFFSPIAIFISNEKIYNAFVGISSTLAFATFVFISYVFRFSLFYFAESFLSIKESIDRGYELLRLKWKETILASLINFSAGIIFGIFSIFFCLFVFLLIGLVALAIKSWITNPFIVGLLIFLALIFVFGFIFSLIALWQCFVLNFWSLFFREIAGKKIISPEEANALARKKKLAELAVKKETDENLKNI